MKDLLAKIPWNAVALAYVAWVGYNYYDFTTSAQSPLGQKIAVLRQTLDEKKLLTAKAEEARNFQKTLELKRAELRQFSTELADMASTFTDILDVPSFLKLLNSESRKVGLRINSIKPSRGTKEEFWVPHHFDVTYNGVYAQIVAFLQRMSQVRNVVRVDTMELKRTGSPDKKLVELHGTLRVTAYTYNRSLADEKANEAKKNGT